MNRLKYARAAAPVFDLADAGEIGGCPFVGGVAADARRSRAVAIAVAAAFHDAGAAGDRVAIAVARAARLE